METLYALLGIGVGTIILILVFFVIFSRFTNRKKTYGQADDKPLPLGSTPDLSKPRASVSSQRIKRDPLKSEESFFLDDLTLIDTTNHEANSPEISISDVDATLIDLIRQAFELPSGLMELSHMLRDPEANIKEVTRLVSTDPVLSSSLLRIANSAAVGRGNITSIQKAIMLLGFNQVWILVNQMLTSRAIKPIAKLEPSVMRRLWLHGAASAVCAKHILLRFGLWGTDIGSTSMTCALIHDVGKFLLRGFDSFDHPLLKSRGEDAGSSVPISPLVDLEHEYYSVDHTRIGYLLSTYWRLPEEICTVIGYHHYPFSSNFYEAPTHVSKELTIVAYADYLAQAAGYYECRYGISALNPSAMAVIGARPPFSAMLDKKLIQELKSTARLIEMATE